MKTILCCERMSMAAADGQVCLRGSVEAGQGGRPIIAVHIDLGPFDHIRFCPFCGKKIITEISIAPCEESPS